MDPEAEFQTKFLRVLLLLLTPLQFFLKISISSNSRNLLGISSHSHNLLHISTVKLLYTVKEKGGKSDRKLYLLPYSLRKPDKDQVWELSKLCPETSMKLYVHEYGFWTCLYEVLKTLEWAMDPGLS